MSEHLTDVDIADYLDDPEGCPRRLEIEAHVAECVPCRDTLSVTQRFDADMDAALMWDFMVAARRRAGTPYSLVALAQQIDAEEREATDYLRSIVMSPYALKRAALSEKPVLHTVGVVRGQLQQECEYPLSLGPSSRSVRERVRRAEMRHDRRSSDTSHHACRAG